MKFKKKWEKIKRERIWWGLSCDIAVLLMNYFIPILSFLSPHSLIYTHTVPKSLETKKTLSLSLFTTTTNTFPQLNPP